MMRVVVWGINYAPEVTGIAPHNVALCQFLREKGAEVEMVTTFPYYPMWRKSETDRNRLYRTDIIDDVPVHRCWHYVPRRVSTLKRMFHEGSFVLTSTCQILSLPSPDVYVVVSPPLLLGFAAWLVTRWKRVPFIFHVQDLQPDAAVGLGMLKSGWFTRLLYWLEAFAYRHAERVSGISEEMIAAFRKKNVPESKLLVFPNGVEMPADISRTGNFRRRHGFGANEFLAIYAGNLGVKQGLDALVKAAEHLRGQANVRIVIAGDGAARPALARTIIDENLTNVSLLPLQGDAEYREMLTDADVSLITQQSGSGNAFFPSKLLVTLAYGSPVVSVADVESALAQAVQKGEFGVNVLPNDAPGLAKLLAGLAADRAPLSRWGANGRVYVQRYERKAVLAGFFDQLERVA